MENTLRKAIINQTVQNIMKNKINLLCVAFFSLLLAGCEKENNDFVGSDNYIISFKLVNGEQEWPAIIADNNITVTVPAGADLSYWKPANTWRFRPIRLRLRIGRRPVISQPYRTTRRSEPIIIRWYVQKPTRKEISY